MPWSAVIVGVFFTIGVWLLIPSVVTGTAASDEVVRDVVPISIAGLFFGFVVLALFTHRN